MTGADRTSESSAASLIRSVGLLPRGPVTWGVRVPFDAPGIYVIETPEPLADPPLDRAAIAAWLARVPTLRVDAGRPTPDELAGRLGAFWIPGETVVYIGLAGTSVARRVGQFYKTPLGDPRPHAGGHWLKTLDILDGLNVWWAATSEPDNRERSLLGAFASRHRSGLILPFANRQGGDGTRKAHGITGSTVGRQALMPVGSRSPGVPAALGTPRWVPGRVSGIDRINAALQEIARAAPDREIAAVQAAAQLARMGLLRDSATRPGKPLRDLLRAGRIAHASQRGGRWFIGASSG